MKESRFQVVLEIVTMHQVFIVQGPCRDRAWIVLLLLYGPCRDRA